MESKWSIVDIIWKSSEFCILVVQIKILLRSNLKLTRLSFLFQPRALHFPLKIYLGITYHWSSLHYKSNWIYNCPFFPIFIKFFSQGISAKWQFSYLSASEAPKQEPQPQYKTLATAMHCFITHLTSHYKGMVWITSCL